jgi:hypothetical protein
MGSELDLARPRGVRELLATTARLFAAHSGLFLSVTLLIVAPYVILVNGVWGNALHAGPDAHADASVGWVSTLLDFVLPTLVTALHAVIVRQLGAGVVPGIGAALRASVPRFPAAVGAVVLYALATIAGVLLLVAPGIWIAVACYFAPQAAVLDGLAPRRALERSAALVRGRWGQVFLALIVGWGTFTLLDAVAMLGARQVHDGVAYVTLLTVIQAVTLSLSALYGTLLFFTLRAARRPEPVTAAA